MDLCAHGLPAPRHDPQGRLVVPKRLRRVLVVELALCARSFLQPQNSPVYENLWQFYGSAMKQGRDWATGGGKKLTEQLRELEPRLGIVLRVESDMCHNLLTVTRVHVPRQAHRPHLSGLLQLLDRPECVRAPLAGVRAPCASRPDPRRMLSQPDTADKSKAAVFRLRCSHLASRRASQAP